MVFGGFPWIDSFVFRQNGQNVKNGQNGISEMRAACGFVVFILSTLFILSKNPPQVFRIFLVPLGIKDRKNRYLERQGDKVHGSGNGHQRK